MIQAVKRIKLDASIPPSGLPGRHIAGSLLLPLAMPDYLRSA